jgi:phage-related baseplate assembly protein
MDAIDISLLPPPDIIESLDYEVILAERKAHFLSLYPEEERADMAARLTIEGEPILIVLQEIAYVILILNARINEAARSNLIAFATGGDLDHRALFYGLTRLPNESDARFRKRILVHIAAINGNGTDERYISRALAADPAVIDAAVSSQQPNSVDVALWIADLPEDASLPPGIDYAMANAAHHAAVLDKVKTAFAAPGAVMLGLSVTVYEARPQPVDVAAVVVRESSAPVDLVADLAARLPALIRAHAELGRDVSRSRLLSWLHVAGVSRVEMARPEADVPIPADGYAVPGDVTLTDGGLAW